MPGEGEATITPGKETEKIETSAPVSEDAIWEEAFDEAEGKAAEKETDKKEPKEEETKAEKPKETPKEEEKGKESDKKTDKGEDKKEDKEPEIPLEYKQAKDFHDQLISDPRAQEHMLKLLAKQLNIDLPEKGKEATAQTDTNTNKIMEAMDPEVKAVLDHVTKPLMQEINKLKDYIEQDKQDKQKTRTDNAKKEFVDWTKDNKETIAKHEKELTALAQEYPDILKNGKKGLDMLLNQVTMKEKIQAEVDKAVKEALGKSSEVEKGVKRFSSVITNPDKINSDSGIKKGDSFESVMESILNDFNYK